MRKSVFLAALTVLVVCVSCTSDLDLKLERTLRHMTLEEKVGQMMQINIDIITASDGITLTDMADTVLLKYKVGSILNVPGGAAVTPEEYRGLIKAIQDKSLAAYFLDALNEILAHHMPWAAPSSLRR